MRLSCLFEARCPAGQFRQNDRLQPKINKMHNVGEGLLFMIEYSER